MSSIDAERWTRLKEIHARVAEAPADQRDALIEELAEGDVHLIADARSLLASCDEAATGMPVPDTETFDAWFTPIQPEELQAGRAFGPFRLVRELAQGGMGVVYEAEQAEPKRRVALKVLRVGIATEAARRRFEREGEILGNLAHPGIASLFGVGTHEAASGERVPFLVMELVRGARPVTAYVEEAGLARAERLRLFLQVADAVTAGHQRGIIHRDLKPANVLVDESGRPKVIDFGIARVTAQDLEPGPVTQTGLVMGTLGYIAPEQLGEDAVGEDVRMDVYALGVILYEMLTGHPPIDVRGASVSEAVRATVDGRPTAATRHDPSMSRDLVLILGKALAKEPDARYASVEALARDVRAFLDDEPIRARPPSLAYQLRLFARRHRVGVVAGVVVAVALAGATVFSLAAANREAEQRRLAEAAEQEATTSAERAKGLLVGSQDLLQTLFVELYDDLQRLPRTLPARLALVKRVEEGTAELRLHAEDDERFLRIAGLVHFHVAMLNYRAGGDHLGRPKEALIALDKAEEAFALLLGREDVAPAARVEDRMHLAMVIGDRADLQHFQGDTDGARETAARAIEMLAALAEADRENPRVGGALCGYRTRLARMEYEAGDVEDALARIKAAVESLPRVYPAGPMDAASLSAHRGYAEATWGEILREQGKRKHARRHLERSLEAFKQSRAILPDDPAVRSRLGKAHGQLGMLAYDARDGKLAETHLGAALELGREQLAHDPEDRRARQSLQIDLARMAKLREAQGLLPDAIKLQREAYEIAKELAAEQPDALLPQLELRITMNHLGGMHFRNQEHEAAGAVLEEAHALAKRLLDKHPENVRVRLSWGEALDALGIARWGSAQQLAPDAKRARLLEARGLFQASIDVHEALARDGKLPETHAQAAAQIQKKVEICDQNLAALDGDDG